MLATASQLFSHLQSDAETSLSGSGLLEPTSEIKILCMRVTDYVQRGGPLLARDLCAVFDHQPSNAVPADLRLDKKGIQFGLSIHSKLYCRKSQCFAVQFRDEYPPCGNLFQGDSDRIRIGKEGLAIAIIRKRCTELHCFKGL